MNLDIYTTEMSKSVWDKAFFMDKIPGVKCVIDFGCADGAMIHYLAPLFPDIKFIGYDINSELIGRARSKTPYYTNVIFFESIEYLISYMGMSPKILPEEICINFSSVLHEIFSSTGGKEDIEHLIEKLQPKFITIRDMYCDEPLEFINGSINTVTKILDTIIHNKGTRVREKFGEYARARGQVKNWNDLTQLLMKLQWLDNGWEEELKEDYFAWKLDDILKLCKVYSPVFECRYQLPYLSETWKKEYGWFNPDAHTHAQFILRRDD